MRSLAVIGPSGDDAVYISGGSSAVTPAPGATVTPLAGIRARAGSRARVDAAQGSLGDVPLTTIVPGGTPGFQATYWNNGDFEGAPALTRVDPTVDLAAAPAGVGPLWSARWAGTVTPSESGLYRLSLLQAGLATLWVGGERVGPGTARGRSSSPARAIRCRPPSASPPASRCRSASTTRARHSCSARRSISRGSRRRPPGPPPPSRPRAAPTPRSSWPTSHRARAWTARRSRSRATRTR